MSGEIGHKKLFWGVYSTIGFVTIRNLFRFVEFVQGAIITWPHSEGAYILSEKEVLFYTLDTVPILCCFVCFIIFNPAKLLPKEDHAASVLPITTSTTTTTAAAAMGGDVDDLKALTTKGGLESDGTENEEVAVEYNGGILSSPAAAKDARL